MIKTKISLLAAVGVHGQLGKDNKLLWNVPSDLKNFKALTMGKTMLMGRKTFESIGRPLPGRTSLIISRNENQIHPDVLQFKNIDEVFKFCEAKNLDELFVIGGGEIYNLFLPFANMIYLSRIDYDGDADVYFPNIELTDWNIDIEEERDGFTFMQLSKFIKSKPSTVEEDQI